MSNGIERYPFSNKAQAYGITLVACKYILFDLLTEMVACHLKPHFQSKFKFYYKLKVN